MPVTKVISSKSVVRSMKYCYEGPSHNVEACPARCLYYGAFNCSLDPEEATQEMAALVRRLGRNKKVQCHSIIQSFDRSELNPNDPVDIEGANVAGQELAKRICELNSEHSQHMIFVFTQADNTPGLLHNHIIICNPSCDDGHALYGYQIKHDVVAKLSDKVCEDLDIKVSDKLPDTKEHTLQRSAVTSAEVMLRKNGKYTWKDDLRNRINQCLQDTHICDFNSFSDALGSKGVNIKAYRRDGVTPLKYTTYSFTDKDGKQRRARDRNLDTSLNVDKVNQELQKHVQMLQEQQRQRALDEARKRKEKALRAQAYADLMAEEKPKPQETGLSPAERRKLEEHAAKLRAQFNAHWEAENVDELRKEGIEPPKEWLHETSEKPQQRSKCNNTQTTQETLRAQKRASESVPQSKPQPEPPVASESSNSSSQGKTTQRPQKTLRTQNTASERHSSSSTFTPSFSPTFTPYTPSYTPPKPRKRKGRGRDDDDLEL